ncbi:6-N-hydroxylaminopurine resistance protein [Rubripirellula obstinata]|uniref:6-N-hydroxylaminopurine resistance protein n=1 Tax=Rubripirellula obstinata TaxID=406547 RepID=A0A5B1CJM9_9BACT|nr:MOSC domain-containing protein [Rubripirellula obstinata]KAA1261298.1 6-N-hydroxylaminopurine resistance protein [Rubripirellula obstinata]
MTRIASIQIGKIVSGGDPTTRDVTHRWWSSAFDKRSIAGPVSVGPMGIVGDEVADKKHHGGVEKAMLCYGLSHYQWWNQKHPELEMGPGGLGENLTIQDQDETSVCIGDRYRVGSCEIEVSQPRQPCWKIARRWGVKSLTKEVGQSGYTGWYVRVMVAGQISTGDELVLQSRPNPSWSIARANDILFGREKDPHAVGQLKELPELSHEFKKDV